MKPFSYLSFFTLDEDEAKRESAGGPWVLSAPAQTTTGIFLIFVSQITRFTLFSYFGIFPVLCLFGNDDYY